MNILDVVESAVSKIENDFSTMLPPEWPQIKNSIINQIIKEIHETTPKVLDFETGSSYNYACARFLDWHQ